jgi:hypothetical protein
MHGRPFFPVGGRDRNVPLTCIVELMTGVAGVSFSATERIPECFTSPKSRPGLRYRLYRHGPSDERNIQRTTKRVLRGSFDGVWNRPNKLLPHAYQSHEHAGHVVQLYTDDPF